MGPKPAFWVATLLPLICLCAGVIWSGAWPVLALLSMTLVVRLLDRLGADLDSDEGVEFPADTGLAVVLGVGQLVLLAAMVWHLSRATTPVADRALLFAAAALWLGQVGNSNAHELIHRPQRGLRSLGKLLFVSVLYGHHASAHPKVHHTHVATPKDPATARLGESFFAYVPRAWIGGFVAGQRAEARMLQARHGAGWWRHDPYIFYVGGALGFCALAAWVAGPGGVLVYLALAACAQLQLLMSDYVQHYGLQRAEIAPGRYAPVGSAHSWNAPHWYSGALMLHAPRHSDHHAHPARPFPQLTLPPRDVAPRLPRSLPVMACVACVPPLWRRMMDRRAQAWAARASADAA
ncbi:alkane 1-monooxygenase [Maribius pontilimi]|uniref:Alkane 1-monooxygenase n=1 Tax=Palleronia pontilimi TaxID=1964209 RepID=A0A934I958_9RHOB|nr:alkane 1-monooxygenase [Palleronia pontilimi]MBJ3762683.1 alkane 1-monooxygenase [Palleronia pontilimi]